MRYLHLLFASFVFLLMQILLSPKIAIGAITPDFSLLLVAYLAINRGPIAGSVVGFLVGFVNCGGSAVDPARSVAKRT